VKKLFILSLIICLHPFTYGYAQLVPVDTAEFNNRIRSGNMKKLGSIRLFEDWRPAKVKITQGKLITGVLVNFEVYSGETLYQNKALYKNDNQSIEILDQLDYIETDFDHPGERRLFMNGFISKDFTPTTFLQVLNQGQYRLLKLEKKELNPGISNYRFDKNNIRLEKVIDYFIADNQSAKNIKLTKSALLKVAGEKKNDLKAFIESNQLDVNQEDNFVRALVYLNEL
jgi:hypothetical protein